MSSGKSIATLLVIHTTIHSGRKTGFDQNFFSAEIILLNKKHEIVDKIM
jgi:hypothetical protein